MLNHFSSNVFCAWVADQKVLTLAALFHGMAAEEILKKEGFSSRIMHNICICIELYFSKTSDTGNRSLIAASAPRGLSAGEADDTVG